MIFLLVTATAPNKIIERSFLIFWVIFIDKGLINWLVGFLLLKGLIYCLFPSSAALITRVLLFPEFAI